VVSSGNKRPLTYIGKDLTKMTRQLVYFQMELSHIANTIKWESSDLGFHRAYPSIHHGGRLAGARDFRQLLKN
jgi:hypothetical protein